MDGGTQIVAELDGQIVGRLVVYSESSGVDARDRRRGIGRELMRAAVELAAEHGATIRFKVAEGNAGAKAFFAAISLVQN